MATQMATEMDCAVRPLQAGRKLARETTKAKALQIFWAAGTPTGRQGGREKTQNNEPETQKKTAQPNQNWEPKMTPVLGTT